MDHKWEQSAISPGESKSNKSIKNSAESLAPSEYNVYYTNILGLQREEEILLVITFARGIPISTLYT